MANTQYSTRKKAKKKVKIAIVHLKIKTVYYFKWLVPRRQGISKNLTAPKTWNVWCVVCLLTNPRPDHRWWMNAAVGQAGPGRVGGRAGTQRGGSNARGWKTMKNDGTRRTRRTRRTSRRSRSHRRSKMQSLTSSPAHRCTCRCGRSRGTYLILLCLFSVNHLLVAEDCWLSFAFSLFSCWRDMASLLGTLDVLLMCRLSSRTSSLLVRRTNLDENIVNWFVNGCEWLWMAVNGRPVVSMHALRPSDDDCYERRRRRGHIKRPRETRRKQRDGASLSGVQIPTWSTSASIQPATCLLSLHTPLILDLIICVRPTFTPYLSSLVWWYDTLTPFICRCHRDTLMSHVMRLLYFHFCFYTFYSQTWQLCLKNYARLRIIISFPSLLSNTFKLGPLFLKHFCDRGFTQFNINIYLFKM